MIIEISIRHTAVKRNVVILLRIDISLQPCFVSIFQRLGHTLGAHCAVDRVTTFNFTTALSDRKNKTVH